MHCIVPPSLARLTVHISEMNCDQDVLRFLQISVTSVDGLFEDEHVSRPPDFGDGKLPRVFLT